MRDRLVPTLAFASALAVVPVAALHFLGRHEVHIPGSIHFGGVGAGALVATGAAIALTLVGARRADGRAVLVGTAFSVMAALLCLHALLTPDVLVESNGAVAFTGAATLPVGAAILALSALPSLRRPEAVGPLLLLQAILLAAVLALGVAGALVPSLVPNVPEPAGAAALGLLAVGLGFYGVLGLRALRTFRLTRRGSDLLVLLGIVWLAAALFAALTLDYWQLGWWLGHVLEVLGIAAVGGAVANDLYRSAQSRPLFGDLRGAELVASEEAFLGSHVRALTARLAAKDDYTEEHTRRVAFLAVCVGEELGLAPERLRSLAAGGLLHDIGKLSVPDAVLQKPGPLDDDEYAIVRRHPDWGVALLRELGGFSEQILRLVLGHHERLDGNGYPQGVREAELDLDTRILAVCDVYDALLSRRVYRPAWTHADAIALLREEAGTAFDPRCVEALERFLAREHDSVLALAV